MKSGHWSASPAVTRPDESLEPHRKRLITSAASGAAASASRRNSIERGSATSSSSRNQIQSPLAWGSAKFNAVALPSLGLWK